MISLSFLTQQNVTHWLSPGGEGAEVIYALRNKDTLANMVLDNIGEAGQIKSFIDNPNDLNKLQNNLTDYAEGVVKSLANYLNVPYTEPNEVIIPDNGQYYIVQKGDTLYSIANRFGLTVDELKAINNLTSNIISTGQQLLINVNNIPDVEDVYVVQKGDTLYSIAKKFGLTIDELKTLNGLGSDIISVGQQLIIKPNNTDTEDDIYIVQKGDSLWAIAQKYNISVDDLIKYNNLSNLTLQIGQQLLIPNSNSNLDDTIYYNVQSGYTIFMVNIEKF